MCSGALRLRGQVFCVSELSAPWSMRLPPGDLAHFHVIECGEAWLSLPRERSPVRLESGDLVILPLGSGHVLSDGKKTTPVLLTDLLAQWSPRQCILRHGGDGPQTHTICGDPTASSSSDSYSHERRTRWWMAEADAGTAGQRSAPGCAGRRRSRHAAHRDHLRPIGPPVDGAVAGR